MRRGATEGRALKFKHTYVEGVLAGTGTWTFEAEWTALPLPGGKTLTWRARHETDSQWRHEVAESGYPPNSAISDADVQGHVIGAFEMAEAKRMRHTRE
jgi:hypothetical protein